ncbi:hypothetical protein [Burkholderia glumae]
MTQKVTVRTQQSGTAEASNAGADLPENVVVDSLGRRLKIEDPDFLTESRIMRMLGSASANTAYVLGYVMPAVRVVEIDGIRVPQPSNIEQIDAAIKRLGREGTAAVLAYDMEQIEEAKRKAEQGFSGPEGGGVDALKNS